MFNSYLNACSRILIVVSLIVFLLVYPVSISAQQSNAQNSRIPKEERLEATITKIIEEKEIEIEGLGKKQLYQQLEAKVEKGSKKNQKIIVESGNIPAANVRKYVEGDKIVITASKDFEGRDVYYITDYVRRTPLLLLLLIFIALTIFIGRKRGIASLFGMLLSFLIIFKFVLPQISNGSDPIVIAVVASFAIIPITFYLSHGFNKKTNSAVLGTFVALILTGFLASYFVDAARLTGFASEEAGFLENMKQGTVNIQGLLLAGIIIGVLGILDDITISQAAIVQQLKRLDPNLTFYQLYSKAMDIGRDHIASMVNTLVLVYTGAALPLLLLFINNPIPFSEVINYEMLAEEIIRTLVASIGLILAVPITTLFAASIIGIDFSEFTSSTPQKTSEKAKIKKFIIKS